VGEFTPICKVLIESGMPYEKDISSDNTLIFSFPIDQSHSRAATEVSMFEQSNMLAMLQSEYADNSVSITIYFNPKTESHDLEHLLAFIAPRVKSCSMLPHSEDGVYAQAPLTGIDKETYEKMKANHPKINWALFGNSDGMLEKFCDSDVCTR
jgi:ribonucleoside-diphosphate reductase alpha chain